MKSKLKIISKDVMLGEEVEIQDFVNIYGCQIGKNSKVGTFVEIQKDVIVCENVNIQSLPFICSGIIIEDNCFVGHNVTFINDRYPQSVNKDGSLKRRERLGSGAYIGKRRSINRFWIDDNVRTQ